MSAHPVKVLVRDGTVTIQFPSTLLRGKQRARRGPVSPARRQALKIVKGMWKRRKLDALTYQREVRGDWN